MPRVSTAVHSALKEQRDRQRRLTASRSYATKLRLAWAKGITTLYKFQSLDSDNRDYTLDIIRNSRIHFSSPESFNDPFDCAPPVELGGKLDDPTFRRELEGEMRRFMQAKGLTQEQQELLRSKHGVEIERLAEESRRHTLDALRASARILCLTATQQHPLMWSHYAQSHTGVCLHFRCDAGNVFGLAREVLYPPERMPLIIPVSRQTDDELTERLIFTKADFWAYEHEYRVIALKGVEWGHTLDERDCLPLSPDLLCGITLGMNIRDRDRQDVLALAVARSPLIPVFKAVQNSQRFWMDVVPFDI